MRSDCLRKKIGGQEYQIEHDDDRLFCLPATKKEKASMLKRLVCRECGRVWQLEDNRVAELKKQLILELIDGIMAK